jgi:very-short-patch-repair endonuclease
VDTNQSSSFAHLFADGLLDETVGGPEYEPPYDSPIEDLFAMRLADLLRRDASLERQVEVATHCGTYRIDFVCRCGGRVIGLECDGREFHDPERDEWRDALIMGTGKVNGIYRFAGSDIHHRLDRALYLLSLAEKSFFTERSLTNLKILGNADCVRIERAEGLSTMLYRWYPEYLAHNMDDQDLVHDASDEAEMYVVNCTDRRFNGNVPEWFHKNLFAGYDRRKSIAQLINTYRKPANSSVRHQQM